MSKNKEESKPRHVDIKSTLKFTPSTINEKEKNDYTSQIDLKHAKMGWLGYIIGDRKHAKYNIVFVIVIGLFLLSAFNYKNGSYISQDVLISILSSIVGYMFGKSAE